MLALTEQVWRTRAYGDFWSYMLVAEGAVDLAAEPELSLWDMAALAPIVTEAGGRFTGLNGIAGPHQGNAAASNGLLHAALLAALGDSARATDPPTGRWVSCTAPPQGSAQAGRAAPPRIQRWASSATSSRARQFGQQRAVQSAASSAAARCR